MRMSEGMKPTRPERNIWHMEAGDARPDASSEPEPLIAPGSVVGLWLVEHLPVVHPHDHAFYEMALVLSGSGFHVCGDSEEPVQAGTVVFVPPGVAHGYRGCRDMEVYNCFFRAELAEFELLWAARDDDLVALFGRSGTRRPQDDHVVMQVDRAAFEQCVGELDAIRLRGSVRAKPRAPDRPPAARAGPDRQARSALRPDGPRTAARDPTGRGGRPRRVRRGPRPALDARRPQHGGLSSARSISPTSSSAGWASRRWPTSPSFARNGQRSCWPGPTTRSRRSAVRSVGRSPPHSRDSSRRPSASARASSGGGAATQHADEAVPS